MQEPQHPSTTRKQFYFLFINSKSGGGKGKQYLTINDHRLDYQYSKEMLITLHFIDLFNQEDREKALNKIKRIQGKIKKGERNKELKVIVCGGDGTVIWVVELVAKYGIDLREVVFGIIPIGTGNDFSRCLGWGGSPIKFSNQDHFPLKNRLIEWLQASESYFDLWTVELTTYEDGTIYQIRDKRQIDTYSKELTRGFCNYFGLGIDARIAYSVQLRRQQNKWLNLFLYGCIGCLKWCKKIQSTADAVQSFKVGIHQQVVENAHQGQGQQYHQKEVMKREAEQNMLAEEDSKNNLPLLAEPIENQPNSDQIRLKEGYGSILALNSVRYMAGLKNVWNTSKLAVQPNKTASQQFTDQQFNDGKIQFLAFKNQLRLGLQRFVNCGAKIAQGQGPFTISFNRNQDNTPTYIHIDGEAMKVRQLKRIVIKKNQLVKDGRIKVLVRKDEQ